MNIYHELILVFLASISAFSLAFIACAVTRKHHVPPELANSLRAQLELATQQVYHIARIAAAQEARNKAMEISLKKIDRMTILVPDIIERKELEVYFRFSRQFVEQWTTGYKKEPGVCMIPPMPHIEGPPMQFHRDSVMKWRLQYFQVTE